MKTELVQVTAVRFGFHSVSMKLTLTTYIESMWPNSKLEIGGKNVQRLIIVRGLILPLPIVIMKFETG